MNDDKFCKSIFIFLIISTLTIITLLTTQRNNILETELYETRQELATQRFYNRLIEQQLHQMKKPSN